jgi:hypothetical protein
LAKLFFVVQMTNNVVCALPRAPMQLEDMRDFQVEQPTLISQYDYGNRQTTKVQFYRRICVLQKAV